MAAELAGRRTGDTVARWVAGFNHDGLVAVVPQHGGGHRLRYGEIEQRRILAEVVRPPNRARDGTATWSLTTLRATLRRAEDGLPGISTDTIGRTLHAAGFGSVRGGGGNSGFGRGVGLGWPSDLAASVLTGTEDSLFGGDVRFGPDENRCGDPAFA
jgi:transposase